MCAVYAAFLNFLIVWVLEISLCQLRYWQPYFYGRHSLTSLVPRSRQASTISILTLWAPMSSEANMISVQHLSGTFRFRDRALLIFTSLYFNYYFDRWHQIILLTLASVLLPFFLRQILKFLGAEVERPQRTLQLQ